MFQRIGTTNWKCRKQQPNVFYKKGAFKSFTIFTGKHHCHSLFFHKVAGLGPSKRQILDRCFPMNFLKILRTPFFYRKPPAAFSELYIGLQDLDI